MDSKNIKQFSWSSVTDAKSEYDEWAATLLAACDREKVGFCINDNFAEYFVPISPTPPAANTQQAQNEYRKELQEYRKALVNYRSKFSAASGYLRSSLAWGTKARMEVDAILDNKPPHPLDDQGQPITGWEWTPEKAFKAAMKHLKDVYAPSDATDCATLRQKISELNDIEEGGFKTYSERFITYHCALVRAGQEPSPTDCTTWVLQGIQNTTVKGVISALIAAKDPTQALPTFREIFRYIEAYLKSMGDSDPYKATKITASGTTKVSLNATYGPQSDIRCTRCWRHGHSWKDCTAKSCSACGKPFHDTKYCIQWESHTDVNTRWAPRHLIDGKKKRKRSQDGPGEEKEIEDKSDALQNLKQAKKIYMAARKEYRKNKNK